MREFLVVLMFVLLPGVVRGEAVGESAPTSVSEVGTSVPEEARSLYLPHRRGSEFFNPWQEMGGKSWAFLRWKLFDWNRFDKWRKPELPLVANDGSYLGQPGERPSVTWVGHATFAVQDGGDVFLTDPHFSKRALLPARWNPPGIPLESIPADAFAVISHNHYDHLDTDTVEALPDSMQWFVPLGLGDWFRKRGKTAVELDWWESARHGAWTITCLPSQHWSSRIDQLPNRSLWCAFLLDNGERTYFFAGDTGYFHGFREFGRRFGPIDVAMLPIGAWAPRFMMRYQHMDPAEALAAFGDLRARRFYPMHYGTFDLTDEPLDQPPAALLELVEDQGLDPERFRILPAGGRDFLVEAGS
ncbi:MBL fold metallo-hydrolase [Myxococcota bacterium]|nr:MBL fold metallo-hydrolase [Myxococcota bacterium]